MVLSILSVIVLAGCQQNPEEGPRKVAQTYFDAVKMGDVEKAFSCYAPEVQQELDMGMDIASGISESASEKLFGFNVDATGIGSSFMGFAAAEAYENYERREAAFHSERQEPEGRMRFAGRKRQGRNSR